jgi:thiamine-monophosphate kinase
MGEFELLARIRERLPAAGSRVQLGSGDDAAVTTPGDATATSVDALVEGVHFRRDLASPAQIGHKALATALSDLAAMGAEPGEAYVVLGVPDDFGEDACMELLDGMIALGEETGTTLAGGDLSRATELFLAITVVGHAAGPQELVDRGGARPGDAIVLTGALGGAIAGLKLLEDPALETGIDLDWRVGQAMGGSTRQATEKAAAALRRRQLEPTPRLGAGRALAATGATAMIDLSDGLGGDAGHLAERSGTALSIDAEVIPRAPGSTELLATAGLDRWQALNAGEDYELLAALPPGRLDRAKRAVGAEEGIALTQIGEVRAGSGVEIRLPDGRLLEPVGFDQLA